MFSQVPLLLSSKVSGQGFYLIKGADYNSKLLKSRKGADYSSSLFKCHKL